jgi:selenophosphate synthetase-related protein
MATTEIKNFEQLLEQKEILKKHTYFEPSIRGFLLQVKQSADSGVITREQQKMLISNI